MKKYPTLTEIATRRDMLQVFGGYNHNLRISEGEFYDMENLTSDFFPVLAPRSKRYLHKKVTCGGLIEKDNLCHVEKVSDSEAYFYINGDKVDDFTLTYDSEHPIKDLISIGSYVVIMPDRKYINTINTDDKGSIDNIFELGSNSSATYTPCTIDGASITVESQPTEPANKEIYWLDTSSTPNALKKYNTVDEKWVSVATTYIKIEAEGIADGFSVGDGVKISNSLVSSINGLTIIEAKGNTDKKISYIVVTGLTGRVDQTGKLVISRKMPEMDYIVECGNRLWGCFFGYDAEAGETKNIIYASKLGDFKNWTSYQGISTSSYYAEVGTDGQFTGAITHRGYPIFFKENYMHKVYGNYPSNFQIQATACRGVQKGSDRSLAIVNETLYYKSKNGICSFDGSMPQEVSSNLGLVHYDEAVGGAIGYKYYVSMRDSSSGMYSTFALDTQRGLWHREDHLHAAQFCAARSKFYFIDVDKDYAIWTTSYTENECESDIRWYAVTGPIQVDTPDKKYISRLTIRLSLKRGSKMSVYIEYDSSDEWEHLYNIDGDKMQSCPIPVIPKRCDHLRLKFVGKGEAKVFSICKVIEDGSDE